MHEYLLIGVAVIILAILIKVGLKILKWGLIALLLYALWRLFIHGNMWHFFK
jgi:hypothetical protein